MNNILRKNLKSAKRRVNAALICLGLPLLPFLVMAFIVLFFSNFDFLGVFYDLWSTSTHVSFPLLFMCFYGAPLISFFRHLKKCLNKGERPSVKKVLLLRAFFTIALVGGCCLNLYFLFLYSSVGINIFSLFVAFFVLTALIGSIFAFSAFAKARSL